MKIGSLQKIIITLQESFDALKVNMTAHATERLAIMIDKAMNLQGRNYHNLDHVFSLSDSSRNPVIALAALFHDIVYYQVDKGFSTEVYHTLSPYIIERRENIYLRKNDDLTADRILSLTIEAFGFKHGQKLLAFSGMNEFLSALFMNKCLEGIVPDDKLLQMSACIEATIPFRPPNKNNQTCCDILEMRLQRINQANHLGLSQNEIEQTVQWTVVFSNKDVDSFAESDTGNYLDSTWKLMPETNAALRTKGVYTIRDYRRALENMEKFLTSLDTRYIFKSYRGVPSNADYERMYQRACTNVRISIEYLGIKLLAMAILEALSELTGGDVPLALFMGNVDSHDSQRMDDYLPPIEELTFSGDMEVIARLVKEGRTSESNFDLRNSPLSLYLLNQLGPEKIKDLIEDAKSMFSDRLSPRDFLSAIDPSVVSPIAHAIAFVAPTRAEELRKF